MKGKKRKNNNSEKLFAFVLFTIACVFGLVYALNPNVFSSLVFNRNLKAAGDAPAHSKDIKIHSEKYYTLSLDVTGEASTEVENPNVNVLVVFDNSNSMDTFGAEYEQTANGRFGKVDDEYFVLYRNTSGTEVGEGNNFTGTMYYRDGDYPNYDYHVYTEGTRYTKLRSRADAAEKVVYDFTQSLFEYKNGPTADNIQMSLVTFNNNANVVSDWTSNADDITERLSSTGESGSAQLGHSSGTNYERALQEALAQLDKADGDQTFVIFVTDGAPSQHTHMTNSDPAYLRPIYCYGHSQDEALRIHSYDTTTHTDIEDDNYSNNRNTTLFGIYAYGDEADYLDDVIYYALNGKKRENENEGTDPTENYFNASDTSSLTAAINSIFNKIVDVLGFNKVAISDGTTSNVETTTGDIAHLLEVDTSSYKYWLTVPVSAGNEIKRIDLVDGEEYTITLHDNGDGTITASCPSKWGEDGSVTVTGTLSGGQLEYEWTESNNLYNYAPPSATFDGNSVDWNLRGLGTLLNGVNYRVEFDVYPSQETYDLIADLKNGEVEYDDLDGNVKKYLKPLGDGYTLLTNSENVKLYYNDSRVDDENTPPKSVNYNTIDPVPTESYKIDLVKLWENILDSQSYNKNITLKVIRDGVETDEEVVVGPSNDWAASHFISTGLMKTKKDGRGNITDVVILNGGHDYSLSEPSDMAYYWELAIETVHPMIIDGTLTTVVKTEDPDVLDAIGDNNYVKYNGFDVFKITYKVGEETRTGVYYARKNQNTHELRAINSRKSNFNFIKKVTGDALPGQRFDFEFTVHNAAQKLTPTDHDVWFSICDTEIDSTCKSADSLVKEENIVTGAEKEIKNGSWTGYYYAENDDEITVKLQDKWNVRVINLGTGSTYIIEETDMPTGFTLESVTGDTIVTETGTLPIGAVEQEDGTYVYTYTEAGSSVEKTITYRPIQTDDGTMYEYDYTPTIEEAKVSGTIVGPNTVFEAVYTNNYPKTNLVVKKVWNKKAGRSVKIQLYQNGEKVEGKTITLDGTKDELGEDEDGETDSWVGTFTNLEILDEDGEVINYSAKEEVPEGYEASYTSSSDIVIKATDIPEGTEAIIATLKIGDEETAITLTKADKFETTISGKEFVDENGELLTIEVIPPQGLNATLSYAINNRTETITNSEVVNVSVSKVWDDANNQDGIRPDSVTFTLSNGDTITLDGKTDTTGEDTAWVATFKNLPKYDDKGAEISYKVTEASVPANYTVSYGENGETFAVDGGTITNIHTPETTEVSVTKVWDDEDNQDGVRPASVTFTLSNGDTITLDGEVDENGEDAAWVATFKDLPKYENESQVSGEQTEIQYTVTEASVPAKYTVSYGDEEATFAVDGGTITNTHETETTEVSVTKVWDDEDNQDGIRPNSVTFTLSNGDTITLDGEVDENGEDAAWVATFKDLPKYENESQVSGEQTEIQYTVTEASVPAKYTVSYGDEEATFAVDGGTITNTHVPETTEVSVTKVWDDEDNQDGIRPSSVTFTLSNGDTITLDGEVDENGEDTAWVATFKDLPKYENESQVSGEQTEIQYTVTEASVPAKYTVSYGDEEATFAVDGGTITNTHVPETTEVSVTKVWDDADNQDGIRPSSVTFTLSNGDTITLDGEVDENGEDTAWVATFKNLPKYENESQVSGEQTEIQYTVTEASVPAKYTVSYGDEEATFAVDGGTITNTHVPDTTEVSVTKVWDDDDNRDKTRPDSVTFTLSNGDTITLDGKVDENGEFEAWVATFKDLPKYENESQVSGEQTEIQYTVTEASVPAKYAVSYGENGETFAVDGGTITNSYSPETTSAMVKKVWDDADNQDGKRPASITVTLTDGNKYNKEVVLNSGNGWIANITGLPKNDQGNPITYTWTEDETGLTNGYKLTNTKTEDIEEGETVVGELTTFTNSYTPETVEVSVTKVWDDEDNQDGIRPESVTFTLSDGKAIILDGKVDENGEDTPWVATFKNLPKYENESQVSGEQTEIQYTVTEASVPANYTVSYGDEEATFAVDGGTITNTHTPETTEVSVTKEWADENNRDGVRPDSVTFTLSNGDTITLDGEVDENGEDTPWVATFKNLPKYENESQVSGEQTEIQYTVTEASVPAKYTVSYGDEEATFAVDGGTITNIHEIETVDVSVTKDWEDDDNRDGVRPDSVTFRLSNGDTITLDGEVDENGEFEAWVATFKDLPKYENETQVSGEATEIEYTVTEASVPAKYTVSYGDEEATFAVDGGTITNTHEIETTEVSVTKEWDDANNQDGARPESVTFTLSNGDTITLDGTADKNGEDTPWVATFKNLPKYENESEVSGDQTEIEYTVTEASVPAKYTVSYGDEEATFAVDGGTITNSYTPETVEVSVTKEWEDDDNRDGVRPASVTFTLSNGDTITLDGTADKNGEDTPWVATFKNLPKYENESQVSGAATEIEYTVTEASVPGNYTVSYGDEEATFAVDGGTITNTHEIETTEVSATKVWDDADNQDGIRPSSVTFKLSNGDTITLDGEVDEDGEFEPWVATFKDLPKYENESQASGEATEIEYTVTEEKTSVITGTDGVGTYAFNVAGDAEEGFRITNTHTPETITITGEKIWVDENNVEDLRPQTVQVNLYGTDKTNAINVAVVKAGADGKWFYTFSTDAAGQALPKYENPTKETGSQKEIDYTVKEIVDKTTASYYTSSIDPNNRYNIINTHVVRKIKLTIKKEWKGDNRYGHTDSIDVVLSCKAGTTEYCGGEDYTYTLSESNDWTKVVNDLPKTDGKGNLLNYTVLETEDIEDYSVSYDYENVIALQKDTTEIETTITNTYTPQTKDIEGEKTWEDEDNNDVIRPESITIDLFDGINEDPIDSITVEPDEDGNWKYSFKNLPVKANGVEIEYTLKEHTVEGYTTIQDGYNFTNYHNPETVTFSVSKVWDDNDNNDGKRTKEVTVRLFGDGVEKEVAVLNEDNNWSHTFKPYKKYKNVDNERVAIKYEIIEDKVTDYEATLSEEDSVTTTTTPKENDTNADQTNTNTAYNLINKHNDEKTSITIKKIWEDDNNFAGKRPVSITVHVYANKVLYKTIILTKDGGWTYTLTGLSVYKDGKKIAYTIDEEPIEDYETVIDGYTITNIFTGGTGNIVPPNTGIDNNTINNILENSMNYFYMLTATLALRPRKFVKQN